MMKIKTYFQRVKEKAKSKSKVVMASVMTAFILLQTAAPVYATDIAGSQIAKGTEKMISDATTWLMILAPVLAGLLIIYFCIRRSAADEMDQKKWNNRIMVAVISCIGAVLGSATLNIIIGYYK